jgi:signal transduction histidine kinase
MKAFSFRIKILVTIVLVISLFSAISFTLFNLFLRDKIINQNEETLNQMYLIRDNYYFTISQHDGRVIKSMLSQLERDHNVIRSFLLNADQKFVYPVNYSAIGKDSLIIGNYFSQKKDISVKPYYSSDKHFNRVFMRMQNLPNCQTCHSPSQKYLGMIIMDIHDSKTDSIFTFTRRFSFYYTLIVLVIIFLLVAYLHYKYIRKSLKQFRSTIIRVNQGNLWVRLNIPEVRELGKLGKDFNEMLETFEQTQKELQVYHKKELENSQKLATIGEMSARIAHEIRNPVTGISRALEVIVSEMKDSDNKPILEEIQRQAQRVNQAISNMLRFSRSKDLTLQEGEINEIINSLVFFLRNQAHDKTIQFETDLSDNIPVFPFDHELMENVLLNLSFNAIQEVPDPGLLQYSTRFNAGNREILICLRDNGGGIPADKGDDIFKPFFTTRTKGTGLGLAISKDIIEKHNGKIWYENNRDAGCSFYISLPL